MTEITESLEQAFRRLNDFVAVQRTAEAGVNLDAVFRLQESVGIADPARAIVRERIQAIDGVPEPDTGQILYGVIVGLLAAQLERETAA